MSEPSISRGVLLTHFDYTLWASLRLLDAAGRLTAEELTRDLQVSHTSLLSRADQKFPTRAEEKGTTSGEGKGDKLTIWGRL